MQAGVSDGERGGEGVGRGDWSSLERGYALTSILWGILLEVLVCCSGFGVTILSSRTSAVAGSYRGRGV